ncbi:unnamed protein product [marine sediment metagenome]|uniref:Uncharacterized protein n=1 Tax=marine sediment metagenome TaxID=412755 RepID=X0W9M0_9ZZZZ
MPNNDRLGKSAHITDEDRFWMKTMSEMAGKSIDSIEAAAKQLVTMITVVEGVYAAGLVFKANSAVMLFIIGLPFILWLVSLFFALQVFKSKKYPYFSKSPSLAKNTFYEIADYKQKHLDWAYATFAVSFIIAIATIVYGLCTGSVG